MLELIQSIVIILVAVYVWKLEDRIKKQRQQHIELQQSVANLIKTISDKL